MALQALLLPMTHHAPLTIYLCGTAVQLFPVAGVPGRSLAVALLAVFWCPTVTLGTINFFGSFAVNF